MLTWLKKNKFLLVAAAALAATIHMRDHIEVPYTWVFCWAGMVIFFAALAAYVRRTSLKCLALVLMALMLGLWAMELYVSYPYFGQYVHRNIDRETIPAQAASLGQGGETQLEITRIKTRITVGNDYSSEIIYSNFPGGWRITPQYSEAQSAVVFFGCSFTYGIGLTDADTFPYKVGEDLGEHYQVYNRGISAYGPHQMLDMIAGGILDDIAAAHEKMFVFFTTFDEHALRSAGYNIRYPEFPWYELVNGQLVRQGVFGDQYSTPGLLLYRLFKKSQLYQSMFIPKPDRLQPAIDLYTAIIKQSDLELQKLYGARLTVLIWPANAYGEILRQQGLDVVDLEQFFPDYRQNPEKYKIPYDGHPNALANEIVTQAIVKMIHQEENKQAATDNRQQ
ncbi:MAG: hypothetical protein LBJ14_08620 [Desulfarculales bacterium]|jgi:hypothetical protein|nr:hypothetical protein [Desulfarculales bacterium]